MSSSAFTRTEVMARKKPFTERLSLNVCVYVKPSGFYRYCSFDSCSRKIPFFKILLIFQPGIVPKYFYFRKME